MRCNNCGWDNPDGNMKCEKCNAPMGGFAAGERKPQYGLAADEFFPSATVAGNIAESFNPRATVTGCASCGYPVRISDTECPDCGSALPEGRQEPEHQRQAKKEAVKAGTIIQGAKSDKDKTDNERKKLTGFLVTYSLSPNGVFFPLYEGKNVVGRVGSCNVFIQGDPAVSEKHFSILYRAVDGKFKFKDEQSSNGTFINGELIDEGELKNLDIISIGSTRLLFMEIPGSMLEQ